MLDKVSADSSSSSAWQPVAAALRLQAVMHTAIHLTAHQDRCREHVIAFIAEAPRLLQQVQRTLALAPDTSASGGSSSSSSSSAGSAASMAAVAVAVGPLQQVLLQLPYELWYAGSADIDGLDALLASDSSAEAAMQLLCAYTHLMCNEHTAAAAGAPQNQRQQQQQLAGDVMLAMGLGRDSRTDAAVSGSSSSSNSSSVSSSSNSSNSRSRSSSACATSFRRPVQAGLLSISPVHQRLQRLPAAWRQLYLQGVQQTAANRMRCLHATLHVLVRHLPVSHGYTGIALNEQQQLQLQQRRQQEVHDLAANSTPAAAPAPRGFAAAAAAAAAEAAEAANAPELAASCSMTTCPALAEQAVLLVIEVLQLLAAKFEQTDQQLRYDSLFAYGRGAFLLHMQLVTLQSCPALRERHTGIVQQSAQQMMQLLRWQLQLVAQRSTPPRGADASAVPWTELFDSISDLAKQALFADLFDYSGKCLRDGV
jgi:hypothetical protein